MMQKMNVTPTTDQDKIEYLVYGTIRFTVVDSATVILDQISLKVDANFYFDLLNET